MIHFVVVDLQKRCMDVVASDTAGHRRKIQVVWGRGTPMPASWAGMVAQEMEMQLDYENELAEGRRLPE